MAVANIRLYLQSQHELIWEATQTPAKQQSIRTTMADLFATHEDLSNQVTALAAAPRLSLSSMSNVICYGWVFRKHAHLHYDLQATNSLVLHTYRALGHMTHLE